MSSLAYVVTFGNLAFAQKDVSISIPFDSTAQVYSYTGVVETAELTDSILYSNARIWLIGKNGNSEFEEDAPNNRIMDKGAFTVDATFSMGVARARTQSLVNYVISLEFKPGRYRYTIYRFGLGGDATSTTPTQPLEAFVTRSQEKGMGRKANVRYAEDVCAAIDAEVIKLISEMRTHLAKPSKKDW